MIVILGIDFVGIGSQFMIEELSFPIVDEESVELFF